MLQPGAEDDEHKGLNFYGPTVIKKHGAVDAEKLFTTWATLFSIGPKRIKLRGDSEIRVYREDVVDSLRKLAKYSKSVANSEGALRYLDITAVLGKKIGPPFDSAILNIS